METSAIQSAKRTVELILGLSKDALHVHLGLAVFLAASYVVRKRFRAAVPLLAVLAAACLGEIFDARDDMATLGRWRWRSSLHDLLNTMFWPVVFTGLFRLGIIQAGDGSQRRE